MVTVLYTMYDYIEATDTEVKTELTCTVQIHPAESDVGEMFAYAEILSCKDSDGNEFLPELSESEQEEIECRALGL